MTTDFSLGVCLFYDTDANLARGAEDGTTASVEQKFLSILSAAGCPEDWLPLVSFAADSHENVERNLEGSNFYRMR